MRNLELLRSGAKEVGDLSDAEKRELVAAERLERGGKSKERPTARQRCIEDEVKREGESPSELTMRIIDLKCSQR
jgi:ribosomal protein L15E